VFRRIEALLDGRHTVDDIVASVNADVLPTTVVFLLKLLQGKGLLQPGAVEGALEDDEEVRWRRQLRFLAHFMSDASSAQIALAKARLGLVGSRDLQQAILSTLGSIGVGCIAELDDPSTWCAEPRVELESLDLIVACEESPAVPFFDAVNRACLASRTRWLRVAISGTSAQLGPTVAPYETACYTCFDYRLRTHESDLDGYLAYRAQVDALDTSRRDEGCIAPLWSIVAAQAALEVMRLLTGFAPPVTVGRFYELNAVSPATISHDVLRLPRCPSCRRRTFPEAWDQTVLPMEVEP